MGDGELLDDFLSAQAHLWNIHSQGVVFECEGGGVTWVVVSFIVSVNGVHGGRRVAEMRCEKRHIGV